MKLSAGLCDSRLLLLSDYVCDVWLCLCVCVKSFRVCSISALVFFLYHVSYVSPVIIRFSVFQELYIVHIAVCTECTEVFSVCIHTKRFIYSLVNYFFFRFVRFLYILLLLVIFFSNFFFRKLSLSHLMCIFVRKNPTKHSGGWFYSTNILARGLVSIISGANKRENKGRECSIINVICGRGEESERERKIGKTNEREKDRRKVEKTTCDTIATWLIQSNLTLKRKSWLLIIIVDLLSSQKNEVNRKEEKNEFSYNILKQNQRQIEFVYVRVCVFFCLSFHLWSVCCWIEFDSNQTTTFVWLRLAIEHWTLTWITTPLEQIIENEKFINKQLNGD